MIELDRRGERTHEAGLFLLGNIRGDRREVTHFICYDELDPRAYSTGVCVLHAPTFAKLWALCREQGLTVVGDVHTHPGRAIQSRADKANPMVARAGHIGIIIPNFAEPPIPCEQMGIYEYRGDHEWFDRSPRLTSGFLYTGFWS